ncbi:hypothetical protein BVRB_6g153770 [Beta vulgaris subsp. vulgaris]|nr:hypothetical protein BVRB_6g153770 [Beta vulgaris subsp. vulgaris]
MKSMLTWHFLYNFTNSTLFQTNHTIIFIFFFSDLDTWQTLNR